MKIVCTFLCILCCFFLSSCAKQSTGELPPEEMIEGAAEIDAKLREAAFRYIFENNNSTLKSRAAAYCLSFEDDRDPPETFIKRLADAWPPVKPRSACRLDDKLGVVDHQTGRRCLVFSIREVVPTGVGRATVKCGYYEANLSAAGYTLLLHYDKGDWSVEEASIDWIS